MISYEEFGWVPPRPDHPDQPRQDRGLAHPNQLIVDERDWPAVEQVLRARSISYRDLAIKYGLVRLTLDVDYDTVLGQDDFIADVEDLLGGASPRTGRNRLATHAELQFDSDEIEATPKVVPSNAGEWRQESGVTLSRDGGPQLDAAVRIGVVDTPFVRHEYLEGSCLYTTQPDNVVEKGETPGHASFVAGLILQVAPGAVIMAEGAIAPEGVADLVAVHDAICELTLAGAHLINLSLGCVTGDDKEPFVLDHAIEWATLAAQQHDRPVPLFVAASGNSGDDRKFWPAADDRVCAVAAATQTGGQWELSDYSGRGPWVDVAARGDNLLSCRPDFTGSPRDAYGYWSGTSFATAVVTGMKAAQLARTGFADLADEAAGSVSFPTGDGPVPVYDPERISHQ